VHELTPEHRAAVEAAIPVGVVVAPEFWAELAETIAGYHLLCVRRARYDVAKARQLWQRLESPVTALALQLGERLALELKRKAEDYAAYHDTWCAFRGTKNPYREFLYGGVLDLWTYRLGGELKYSTAVNGLPSGPLVRFFHACVWPVLGDETPAAGLADIVNRERKRRQAVRQAIDSATRRRSLPEQQHDHEARSDEARRDDGGEG
jgi:hypothetical protein